MSFKNKFSAIQSSVHFLNKQLLNTASFVMRLRIQTEDPSDELERLCAAVVNWYLPCYFLMKEKHHISNAAPNFFQAMVFVCVTCHRYTMACMF